MPSQTRALLAGNVEEGPGDLVVYARVLVLLHALLRAKYYTVVATLIEPRLIQEVKAFWKGDSNRKWLLVWKSVGFMIISSLLPWVYAWSVMQYPCKMTEMNEIYVKSGTMNDIELAQKNCAEEDALRSWTSLLVMPISLCTASLLFLGSHWLDGHCFGTPFLGRKLRDLARHYGYALIGTQLTKVKYTTSFYYNMITAMYVILVGQLLLISLRQGSTIGAVVGYAVGRIFLIFANLAFDPGTELTSKVDGIIHDFGKDEFSSGMLTRLGDAEGNTLYTNASELRAISKLQHVVALVKEFSKPIDPPSVLHPTFGQCFPKLPQELYTDGLVTTRGVPWWRSKESSWYLLDILLGAWQSYPAKFVYVGNTGETVDVVSSKVSIPLPQASQDRLKV